MSIMSFLSGLPAMLGIAGFFAYLWFGRSKIGGDILKEIVGKLRTNPTRLMASSLGARSICLNFSGAPFTSSISAPNRSQTAANIGEKKAAS